MSLVETPRVNLGDKIKHAGIRAYLYSEHKLRNVFIRAVRFVGREPVSIPAQKGKVSEPTWENNLDSITKRIPPQGF